MFRQASSSMDSRRELIVPRWSADTGQIHQQADMENLSAQEDPSSFSSEQYKNLTRGTVPMEGGALPAKSCSPVINTI